MKTTTPPNILESYRRRNKLTQEVLAAQIGVRQGQLSHWLNGNRRPNPTSIILIAAKTGLSEANLKKGLL